MKNFCWHIMLWKFEIKYDALKGKPLNKGLEFSALLKIGNTMEAIMI